MIYADIQRRIIDISRRHNLCHLGSCFSTLPILLELYTKHSNDIIVLSNGHSGLALYAVLEARYGFNAEELLVQHGIHPCYDPEHHIYCSTGSLGMGLSVAVGYALAGRQTHCIVSDGECSEGIVWESLAFASTLPKLPLSVHINANGWSATQSVNIDQLERRLMAFLPNIRVWRTENYPFANDLAAHYEIMTKEKAEQYATSIR